MFPCLFLLPIDTKFDTVIKLRSTCSVYEIKYKKENQNGKLLMFFQKTIQ